MEEVQSSSRSLSTEIIGEIQILLAVVFFGVSFIFQRQAMLNGLGPCAYNACRFTVAALLMVIAGPFVSPMVHTAVEQEDDKNASEETKKANYRRDLLFWGGLCGATGFGGSMLQQIGIVRLTAGKTGFITGMFVIFVPIVEWLTPGFGAQLTYKSWLAALGSMFGLYLLSGCTQSEDCLSGAAGQSEVVVFVGMLFWTVGIMCSDVGAKRVNAIDLMTINFVVVTLLSALTAVLFEPHFLRYPYTAITDNWFNIVANGVTEALAFCLGAMGQRYTPPTRASILFSLETVSCAIFSYFFLRECLDYVEMTGAALMVGSGFLAKEITEEVDVNELQVREGRSDTLHSTEMELPLWRKHTNFGAVEEQSSAGSVASGDSRVKYAKVNDREE